MLASRSKTRTLRGGFRAQFSTYNGKMIKQPKEPTTPRPKEMAAADGKGFAGVRKLRDGSTNYGEVDRPDREGAADNQITVRRERSGVVLEIAFDDELVEVEIDPTSAVNLIAHLQAALGV